MFETEKDEGREESGEYTKIYCILVIFHFPLFYSPLISHNPNIRLKSNHKCKFSHKCIYAC